MKFLEVQIKNALEIVSNYSIKEPFHLYLKNQFKFNKNWGGKDRKNYRKICYTYWRYFKILQNLSDHEKFTFLYQSLSDPNFLSTVELPNSFEYLNDEISNYVSFTNLNQAFLQESPVYFRILENKKMTFIKHLEEKQVDITEVIPNVFKFPSQFDLSYFVENGFGYIQDLSSQLAMDYITKNVKCDWVWDCCSGAGGKSLDLAINNPNIRLFCSDKRQPILDNLKTRFKTLGLKIPQTQEIDLLKDLNFENEGFYNQKLVVADVPCTGSGTWRRNPENLAYFNTESISKYSTIQLSILNSLERFVAPQGYIYFMTCSVFKKENEDNCLEFSKRFNFKILSQTYFGGPENDCDTIFGCLMQKA